MKRESVACTLSCVVVLVCMVSSSRLAAADDNQQQASNLVVNATCDPHGMIPQGSPFWGHLGSLLAQLVENTPYTPSFSFKTRFGGRQAPAFGEAHCRTSPSRASCQSCLRQLSNDIWRICNSALGAHVEYPDCGIHYECYYF